VFIIPEEEGREEGGVNGTNKEENPPRGEQVAKLRVELVRVLQLALALESLPYSPASSPTPSTLPAPSLSPLR
jgi:hypothetical protein